MKKRVLIFTGIFIGLPQMGTCSENHMETAQAAIPDYASVVSELPWLFDVAKQETSGGKDGEHSASSAVRYEFISHEPIKKTTTGGLFLQADLTVTQYANNDTAKNAWNAVVAKTHPDMGLSYAWDHLILKDSKVYHLHAACTFSEESMDIMTFNLRSLVVPEQFNLATTIHCRCGGGCILSGQDSITSGQ